MSSSLHRELLMEENLDQTLLLGFLVKKAKELYRKNLG